MPVSDVPVGQAVGVQAVVHLHVLELLLPHEFVQEYVAYVPKVPASEVPAGQEVGVQAVVHLHVLELFTPQELVQK